MDELNVECRTEEEDKIEAAERRSERSTRSRVANIQQNTSSHLHTSKTFVDDIDIVRYSYYIVCLRGHRVGVTVLSFV